LTGPGTTVYVDSSAVLKRVFIEPESTALADTLRALERAEDLLEDPVLRRARAIDGDMLRALDAIHLSAAVAVGAEEMITDDGWLAEVARQVGIAVKMPS